MRNPRTFKRSGSILFSFSSQLAALSNLIYLKGKILYSPTLDQVITFAGRKGRATTVGKVRPQGGGAPGGL